jgi:hypothetical protein
VPVDVLKLLTWEELSIAVCGRGDFDVKLLQDNTRYEADYSAQHRVVKDFWEVLAEFSPRRMSSHFVCAKG